MAREWAVSLSLAVLLALSVVGAARVQATSAVARELGVPYLVPPSVVALDERQREQITVIRRELHDRHCTLTGELLQAEEDLRAQLARQPRSPEAVAEASRRIAEIQERIVAARAEAQAQAEKLLTPTQQARLAKWREGQRRAGGEPEDVPYTVLPSIKSDDPDIENLEDPELKPRY